MEVVEGQLGCRGIVADDGDCDGSGGRRCGGGQGCMVVCRVGDGSGGRYIDKIEKMKRLVTLRN